MTCPPTDSADSPNLAVQISQNSIVLMCAIISIVTCCFSINQSTWEYRRSTEKLYRFHEQLLTESSAREGNETDREKQKVNRKVSYQLPW